jgi:hypothetical protein
LRRHGEDEIDREEEEPESKDVETPSYLNKKWTCKEVNLEDLQGRAVECQDSSQT